MRVAKDFTWDFSGNNAKEKNVATLSWDPNNQNRRNANRSCQLGSLWIFTLDEAGFEIRSQP